MTDELAASKERLGKEIEEVRARINGHQQLASKLELSLLQLRAKPRPFGRLTIPTQKQIILTTAEKLRLRYAAEILKQELGKFIGIRISDYKHEPQSFVVELTVTNNRGIHVGPYYAAFKKNPNGSYKVIKSFLPHIIIMSETQQTFPLENDQDLGEFVRELHDCCQCYVDRKDQIEALMTVRDLDMIPTASFDDGYLFLQLGVMLDKMGAKLNLHYHHNRILPHKFTLSLNDTNAHRKWSESFKLLYKCSLVEALGLLTVKENSPETERDTDSPFVNLTTATSGNSKTSRKTIASPRKSPSNVTKKAKRLSPTFNFSDSSADEANRSERIRKKKAKISSNIRRKTYWGTLSQQTMQKSTDSEKNSESSIVDSDSSRGTTSVKIKPANSGKKPTVAEKKTKAKKPLKGASKKQPREVGGKGRRRATPPAVSDSELSDDGDSVSKAPTSAKKSMLAPIFRKSAARGSVRIESPVAEAPSRTEINDKRPLLAAVFHKARRSLQALDQEESESTKPSKEPTGSSRTVQSSKDKSQKNYKETGNANLESPQKNSQSSSEISTVINEEQVSDTVISETKLAESRTLTGLVPNSQETSRNRSDAPTSWSALLRSQSIAKASVSLPRIEEKALLLLSPHKQKASEVSAGLEIVQSQDVAGRISPAKELLRRSLRKKDGDQDGESGVGVKEGGKKASSEILQRRIQDENPVKRNLRRKDGNQDAETGVGIEVKKGGKKASSEILQSRIQDGNPMKRNLRRKGGNQDTIEVKKGGKTAASEVDLGKRKRII